MSETKPIKIKYSMEIRKLKTNELNSLKELVIDFTQTQNKIAIKINPLFKLFNSNNESNFSELKSEAKKTMRSKKGVIYAVFEGKKPVGYIYAIIEKLPSHARIKKRGYICSMVVDKKYRRKGVATKLYTEVKKWFKSKNLEYVALMTLSSNRRAISTYRKWGFFTYLHTMMKKI